MRPDLRLIVTPAIGDALISGFLALDPQLLDPPSNDDEPPTHPIGSPPPPFDNGPQRDESE